MSGLNQVGGIGRIIDPEITVVTAADTLIPTERVIDVTVASANYNITLPSYSNCVGAEFFFRVISATVPYMATVINTAGTAICTLHMTGQVVILKATPTGWVVLNETFLLTSQEKVVVKALTAATTTAVGGVLTWRNPSGKRCIITEVIFDITTKSTGAATLDVGVDDAADTSNDTIMDGVDVGTAAGIFDNHTNAGTHGLFAIALPAGYYVVATASATVAGLVGTAIIKYVELA